MTSTPLPATAPAAPFSSAERRLAYLVLTAMPWLFTANLVIGRAVVDDVAPWTLAFLRWAIAAAVLIVIARRQLALLARPLAAEWRMIGLLGFLGCWICGGIVYVSLHHTTATNGTLIYTTSAMLIPLFDYLVRGTRVRPLAVAGLVLGLVGVFAIVVRGSLAELLALRFNPGDLGFAACTIAWSVYSVILKRPGLQALPTMPLFAAIASAGALLLAPVAALEMAAGAPLPTSVRDWAAIAGIALLSSVGAFSAFQYGLRVLGPLVASVFTYLMPPAGVIMAVIFLGETLRPYHYAGFVLIVGGLVLATAPIGRPRPPAPAADPEPAPAAAP
jgi:drug/metabolite transporter (DMT)-like permease